MKASVHFKAVLYFIPVFLGPFADKLGDLLYNGEWPKWPHIVGCSIAGLIAGCIALRAFYDGSYERSKADGNGAPLPPQPIPHTP